MIMDKKTVLTGSYNWTRNAAIYNQENIISLTDSEIAQRFQEEFNRLWKDSADLMN
jgi:phosphatidylserine/phosphatidylglycerophosphate/cardiolipin synthase-like enzyme